MVTCLAPYRFCPNLVKAVVEGLFVFSWYYRDCRCRCWNFFHSVRIWCGQREGLNSMIQVDAVPPEVNNGETGGSSSPCENV